MAVFIGDGRVIEVGVGRKGPLAAWVFAGVLVSGIKSSRQFGVGLDVPMNATGGVGVYVDGFSAHKGGPTIPWLNSCSWMAKAKPACCTLVEILTLLG